MKKIILFLGIAFLGYTIGIMTYASGDKIIGSEISPNGKYKLIYKAVRYGGIFPPYWRHYVELRDISTGKRIMGWFVKSDDIKARHNETHWQGDSIIMTDPDFSSAGNALQEIVITEEQATFRFSKGFATE
ncbi:MAG: hypothetical protein RBU23_04860 [Candidatus Auribacterota bacterium]|jgi:hypothetical protein|nr:hypothetical protein [Candidatus Auribacterota bacterium]